MLNQDKSFKSYFDHFSSEPDPEVWTGIKSELQDKKKKRGLLFLGFGAAILLVSIVTNMFNQTQLEGKGRKTAIDLPFGSRATLTSVTNGHILDTVQLNEKANNAIVILKRNNLSYNTHSNIGHVNLMPYDLSKGKMKEDIQTSENSFDASTQSSLKLIQFKEKSMEIQAKVRSELLQLIKWNKRLLSVEFVVGKGQTFYQGLDLQQVRQSLSSVNMGLNIIASNRHSEWQVGILYNHSKNVFLHSWNETSIFLDSIKMKKRYSDELRYKYYNDTLVNSYSRMFDNEINQLRLRIARTNNLRLSRALDIYSKYGISANYMFNTKLITSFGKNEGAQYQTTPKQRDYNAMGLGIELGLGVLYQVYPGVKINLGIEASMQSNHYRLNSQKVLPYNLFFNFGVRKILSSNATISKKLRT
jgi:hypothetical protein